MYINMKIFLKFIDIRVCLYHIQIIVMHSIHRRILCKPKLLNCTRLITTDRSTALLHFGCRSDLYRFTVLL